MFGAGWAGITSILLINWSPLASIGTINDNSPKFLFSDIFIKYHEAKVSWEFRELQECIGV
jgi:hypothetical protein